jgi:hypothetical protein
MPSTVSPALQQGHVDRGIGLGARMRLDVGVIRAEQGLGPIYRQLLDIIDNSQPP